MGAGGGFWWNTEEFAEVMGYIILASELGASPTTKKWGEGFPDQQQVSRGTWQVHYRVHVLMLINVNGGNSGGPRVVYTSKKRGILDFIHQQFL